MIQVLASLILIAATLPLCFTMFRKPLSEDDGYWFYLATFWGSGVRQYKGFKLHGYWGVPWIATLFFRAFRPGCPNWPYYFKALWYVADTLSVYALAFVFWHDPVLATLAGLIFALCIAQPNTLFFLTYAEHFYILPLNVGLICAYLGLNASSITLSIAAGLFLAWAFQMKSTCLLYGAALPFMFLSAARGLSMISAYTLAYMTLTLAPLVIIHKYQCALEQYLDEMFGSIAIYLKILGRKLRLTHTAVITPADPVTDMRFQYLEQHQTKPLGQQFRDIVANLGPAWRDLFPVLILAAFQLAPPRTGMPGTILFALLFLAGAIYLIQKNYYTPHLNPLWVPAGIMAARTISEAYSLIPDRPSLVVGLSLVMAVGAFRPARAVVRGLRKDQATQFGFLWPGTGLIYQLAATIGGDIAAIRKPADRLLVWGDCPSIHLYAQTPAWRQDYLFVYALQPHPPLLEQILSDMRTDPPEMIQFINWTHKDDLDMDHLSARTGIPYSLVRNYGIADRSGTVITTDCGITLYFPLFRRNDEAYCEILLDQARQDSLEGQTTAAHAKFERLLELYPLHFEAMLGMKTLDLSFAEIRELLIALLASEAGNREKAVILRHLAELAFENGQSREARQLYQEAVIRNREDFRAYNRLGEIDFMEGNLELAHAAFAQSILLHPYSAEAFNNMGVLQAQIGNLGEARDLFEKALSLAPDYAEACTNLKSIIGSLNH